MLVLARREQTNGYNVVGYSKLFVESLFEQVSVSICQISVTDHPGHVVFLIASRKTYLSGGEKMLRRYMKKRSPGIQYRNFTPKFPYRMAETSKHGNKTEKIPSDWRWLVSLFGSRNSY